MNGVGEGSTRRYGGCAQAWRAECGLSCGGEIEGGGYVTVKTTFGFGLWSN